MSVKVDLDQLADALADFTFAYLVTVGDDFRAHTVAVDPVLADGVLDVGRGRQQHAQECLSHADVTLVWPPGEPGGYTLIVDGRADSSATVVPSRAVLHRKATPGVADEPGCPHDCVPVERLGTKKPGPRRGPGLFS